jgi:hypothetical protein
MSNVTKSRVALYKPLDETIQSLIKNFDAIPAERKSILTTRAGVTSPRYGDKLLLPTMELETFLVIQVVLKQPHLIRAQ